MKTRQIALPLPLKNGEASDPNADLIGRSYDEEYSTVTVTGTCLNDTKRVLLRRDPGGNTWSMPSWLVRLIFIEKKGRRAA
jgi:hypothetical protein